MPMNRLEEVNDCLVALLPREDMVLSFDRSFIDDLPQILKENYGIYSAEQGRSLAPLRRLLEIFSPVDGSMINLEDLPVLLEKAGVNKGSYIPLASESLLQKNASQFSHWSMTTADTDKGTVLTLQRDLAMGTYNKEWTRYPKRLEPDPSMLRRYLFMVTTVSPTLFQRLTRRSFWQLQIAKWKNRGWIDSISPSLSVGPRWLTEIAFFREIVGLRSHIGLDLFSDDESFVRAGDMHKMPFPDRHFQLIFIKNTMDKSYDIRTVVAELIRVSRPGGIIIVDQICGYGDCSPLTRTDIQSASNLLRLFKAKSLVEVLVQKDFDLDKVKTSAGRDRAKRNVRLALRVRPAE